MTTKDEARECSFCRGSGAESLLPNSGACHICGGSGMQPVEARDVPTEAREPKKYNCQWCRAGLPYSETEYIRGHFSSTILPDGFIECEDRPMRPTSNAQPVALDVGGPCKRCDGNGTVITFQDSVAKRQTLGPCPDCTGSAEPPESDDDDIIRALFPGVDSTATGMTIAREKIAEMRARREYEAESPGEGTGQRRVVPSTVCVVCGQVLPGASSSNRCSNCVEPDGSFMNVSFCATGPVRLEPDGPAVAQRYAPISDDFDVWVALTPYTDAETRSSLRCGFEAGYAAARTGGADLSSLNDLANVFMTRAGDTERNANKADSEGHAEYAATLAGKSLAHAHCARELRRTLAQLKPNTPREAGMIRAGNEWRDAKSEKDRIAATRWALGTNQYPPGYHDQMSVAITRVENTERAYLLAALADDSAEGVK